MRYLGKLVFRFLCRQVVVNLLENFVNVVIDFRNEYVRLRLQALFLIINHGEL